MKLALKWFAPITLAAMGLAWCSEQVALLLGFEPPPQDLVKLFTDPGVAWSVKAKYAAIAVLAAPVVEELIFRKGLFGFCIWCGRRMKRADISDAGPSTSFPLAAALATGAVFAAVHFHAATFVPLWFLGVAFAWLYWKSGTVFSSMLCHFLFNLVNLVLCLVIGADAV
jgi:membrane protease YdiL (CAAX protease family)